MTARPQLPYFTKPLLPKQTIPKQPHLQNNNQKANPSSLPTQGLQVIYAASGSREDILKLAAKAKPHHIQVVSKDDLLSFSTSSSSSTSSHPPEDHAAALSALTWDQQGALDWEVLARATYFSGPVFSSFAWNIAVRRHYYNEDAVREKGGGHGENPWAVQEDEPGVVWADGLSEIVLKREVPNPMEQIAHAGMIP